MANVISWQGREFDLSAPFTCEDCGLESTNVDREQPSARRCKGCADRAYAAKRDRLNADGWGYAETREEHEQLNKASLGDFGYRFTYGVYPFPPAWIFEQRAEEERQHRAWCKANGITSGSTKAKPEPTPEQKAKREARNDRDAQIVKLREDGLSFAKIGEKFGLSHTRARKIYIAATN